MTRRKRGLLTPGDYRQQWQKDNAAKCGCGGTYDLCPCQNDPELFTRPHIDWQSRCEAAESELSTLKAAAARIAEGLERLLIVTDLPPIEDPNRPNIADAVESANRSLALYRAATSGAG